MADRLTHLDNSGRVRMVDVSAKDSSERQAIVRGEILMAPATVELVVDNQVSKGNVLETARLAGIMAAKRTSELIPLCHPLNLSAVEVDFTVGPDRIEVESQARVDDRTGVEMEALTAATVALLTIYDMCKAVDRGMVISQVRLQEKSGGRSGHYRREE
ncbi:MAG TPA: cyclic pyranopterin monophosphate synthase MoaC [Candidatus Latescibacteria bacterium]|jgi:cyclic pyranopterin phosphate synthase|nr:cyclic pyranopterin monophosphate synthase MoaC [Gemmatimonadaceae bacterium]MDP6018214.1 cyclic pyranopterin monophosphate synthase MoaC [Candidatus Latescibacterota bacterium]HJP29321.1 cyclic pyranopterin monophosphate synthase MoaC [Candidatus Latescibacterota bacterium]|tara:strand:+ start:168 stop:644 length:477 start_codon:yes stop_codon:yes gene_type:complete